jgi:hypothetical protein
MQKERLTDKGIEQDIIAFKKSDPPLKLRLYEKLIYLEVILVCATITGFSTIHWGVGVACIIAAVVVFAVMMPFVKREHIRDNSVICGEYTVIKDTLVNVRTEIVTTRRRYYKSYKGRYELKEHEFLYFSSRKWHIPRRCYEWSTLYNMSGNGISNTSIIGDEFYLVILNSTQEICVAYNTKFFDYQ